MVLCSSMTYAENKWYDMEKQYNIGFRTDGGYLLNFSADSIKGNGSKVVHQNNKTKEDEVIEKTITNILNGICGVFGAYVCILILLIVISNSIIPIVSAVQNSKGK